MASIFNEISIEWGDVEYHITPTMKLINKIENEVSLTRLAMRASTGDVPLSQVALVFMHLLNSGGCQVSQEQVFQAMFEKDGNAVVMEALNLALTAFFPTTESNADLKKSRKVK